MSTKDELKQRELQIIKWLRQGHSRKWCAARLEEEYNLAPSTAMNQVQEIGSQLNKSLEGLSDDAASYIYDVLQKTIDDTIDDDDRRNRLKALELLAKICKVGEEKTSTDLNIKFTFDN